jgi:hypothetical protein
MATSMKLTKVSKDGAIHIVRSTLFFFKINNFVSDFHLHFISNVRNIFQMAEGTRLVELLIDRTTLSEEFTDINDLIDTIMHGNFFFFSSIFF